MNKSYSSSASESKKSMVQSSRFKQMPSKQQTLLPIYYEIAQENDQDLQWFENQFISYPKTATFKSNTNKDQQQQQQQEQQQQQQLQQQQQQEQKEQQLPQPIATNPPNSNAKVKTQQLDSNSAAQFSPNQSCSQKQIQQQQPVSANSLTPKQSPQPPNVNWKPPKILDRSKTPKESRKDPDFSEVSSLNGERTPSKGILKNKSQKNLKASKFSRAGSEYHREHSVENHSNKSIQTSKSKKVKFDPKSIREKNRNFMFI